MVGLTGDFGGVFELGIGLFQIILKVDSRLLKRLGGAGDVADFVMAPGFGDIHVRLAGRQRAQRRPDLLGEPAWCNNGNGVGATTGVEAAAVVGAKRTYLTHITHHVTHAELLARLPDGVFPAYDGLTVEVG